jgi:hypothetical protein
MDGKFLVRVRPGATAANEYILGVVFHAKPTHHLIAPDPTSGAYSINKRSFGDLRNIEQVGVDGCGWVWMGVAQLPSVRVD